MSAPLEEIAKEFNAEYKDEDNIETSIRDELPIIFLRLIYIIISSYIIYFGIGYLLVVRDGYSWDKHVEMVLNMTFILGIISVLIVGLRGRAASAIYMAGGLRMAWTGKKLEPGAMNYFRNFAFGIKWDTILFYGSVTVFLTTFIFLR